MKHNISLMSSKIINELGFLFDESFDVQGRLSISDLFPKSKTRCGIYLLNFSDDTYYIGQAIDAVKRFSQHRKNYNNIIKYWFLPVKGKDLNEVEQRLIQQAEQNGLLITNKTFVSNVIGDTDLDLIISPIEQNNWLENNIDISNDGYDLYSGFFSALCVGFRLFFAGSFMANRGPIPFLCCGHSHNPARGFFP